MKVGIACYPTHGGSGVVASELALGLAKRGHEVHIVSYATPFRLGSFQENLFIHEVTVASYPLFRYPPYALSLATKLVDVAQEYDLDIIHSHYAVPHAASAYLAKKILGSERLKIITTLHGTDITLVGVDESFNRVVKFAIEESDGVTAVSKYLRNRTIEEFHIRHPIRVIPNFVDNERFGGKENPCGREHFAQPDEKILMHASNFRPVKRVGDTVRVFERIRKKIPAKLLLVGEGPERLFVQQLVKELKISEDVRFLGEQDYLEEILNCADLFLLPSEQESFGLAALEAHASGVPVIATRTGGLPEVVVEGETGFLVPVGEIDSELHSSFRENARRLSRERFDIHSIIPQYEEFYRETMEQ